MVILQFSDAFVKLFRLPKSQLATDRGGDETIIKSLTFDMVKLSDGYLKETAKCTIQIDPKNYDTTHALLVDINSSLYAKVPYTRGDMHFSVNKDFARVQWICDAHRLPNTTLELSPTLS